MQHEQAEERAACLKRLAAQVFVQLPEDKAQALAILALVHDLIEWQPLESVAENVVKIAGG
jgi:hypothetical protein